MKSYFFVFLLLSAWLGAQTTPLKNGVLNGTTTVPSGATLTLNGNVSANGVTVTPAEMGYIGTLTSDAQTQIDAGQSNLTAHIADADSAHAASAITGLEYAHAPIENLVFAGDSIANWTDGIKAKLASTPFFAGRVANVRNTAVDGRTLQAVAQEYPNEGQQWCPRITGQAAWLVVLVGSNDYTANPYSWLTNTEAFLDTLETDEWTGIVWFTKPRRSDDKDSLLWVHNNINKANRVSVAPRVSALVDLAKFDPRDTTAWWYQDGVHYNAAFHTFLADLTSHQLSAGGVILSAEEETAERISKGAYFGQQSENERFTYIDKDGLTTYVYSGTPTLWFGYRFGPSASAGVAAMQTAPAAALGAHVWTDRVAASAATGGVTVSALTTAALTTTGAARIQLGARIEGKTTWSTGAGLEMYWDAVTGYDEVAYDRTGAAFRARSHNALSHTFKVSSTTRATIGATGLVVVGDVAATSLNGNTVTAGTGTLTLAASSTLATSGAHSITLTSTGATNVTLPTSGTLITGSTVATATTPPATYAAGATYTLTASDAALDFGTTDPTITFATAGTYLVQGRALLKYNAATYAGNETATIKLRRTNNTPADIANATTTAALRIITTITDTVGVMPLPPVIYTASAGDVVTVYGSVSATPAAGSVDCTEASIVAIRLY